MKSLNNLNAFEVNRIVTAQVPLSAGNYVNATVSIVLDGVRCFLKPSQIVYSQNIQDYSVTFEIEDSNRTYIVREKTLDALKRKLIEKFGDAVSFSVSKPSNEEDPRAALARLRDQDTPVTQDEIQAAIKRLTHDYGEVVGGRRQLRPGTEITLEMCRKAGIRKKVFEAFQEQNQKSTNAVAVQAFYDLCRTKTPAQVEEFWHGTVLELIKDSEVAHDFVGQEDFFNWHDNFNWNQLVKACMALGTPEGCCPPLNLMIKAYRYCRANGHFHVQRSYKRGSEQHIKEAVREFSPEAVQQNHETAHASAIAKINAAHLPVGTRITIERSRQLGLTNEEFEALVSSKDALRGANFGELQASVRANFNKDPRVTGRYRA